jgi:hypothetical protein
MAVSAGIAAPIVVPAAAVTLLAGTALTYRSIFSNPKAPRL